MDAEEIESIVSQCLRFGEEIPEYITKAPTLKNGLELYFDIFNSLTTDRTYGFGFVGPIPTMAIINYCDYLGVDDVQKKRTVKVIRLLDFEYLKIANEKK